MPGSIVIKGARQHNLKDLDLELPHRKLIAVTGVSGSGKSSLAFDTIYAEGQRRYIESLSTYARQFIEKLERPDLDSIYGISPTIAIRQKNTVTSARSTVGTATEIYDYLRLLFARIGKIYCPACGIEVRSFTPSEVAGETIARLAGRRVHILMPGGKIDSETWEMSMKYFISRGYTRMLIGNETARIEEIDPARSEGASYEVILDRVIADEKNRSRIAEVCELAYAEHAGEVVVNDLESGDHHRFKQAPSCAGCGRDFAPPTPLLFSFNSPYGACPDCRGFGDRMEFSERMIVPDAGLSLEGRAVDPWARERFEYFHFKMIDFCRKKKIPLKRPWSELPEATRSMILEGEGEYTGVIPFLERMKEKSYKKGHRFFTRRYMDFTSCRGCNGTRLRKEAGFIRVGDWTIGEMVKGVPSGIIGKLDALELDETQVIVSRDIMSELRSRLGFMIDVGLAYLTLDRLTRTLSGGEAQRINLANSLGANLVDTLYVLDEPSVGLHAADNERLVKVMHRLRDIGNTVIVVEHDPDIILSSDHLLDIGPGPGSRGGEILFNGSVWEAESADAPDSITLDCLFGDGGKISLSRYARKRTGTISLGKVSKHNLKDVDVDIPLGNLVCVTGVSGSGKSSLVVDVLYSYLAGGKPGLQTDGAGSIDIEGQVDRVLLVDQSPIGSSPRSNPVTYIKGFSYIRELFAAQKKSLARGYLPGRFSFNKSGGRCVRCQGMGYRRVEMHFMADVFVPCEECGGRRYNRETLEIEFRGKNISDALELTVDEAIMFFDGSPQLGERLWLLAKTGLGYLKLGQPSNTLSGGEAQRIKIARELAESKGVSNLYIMDEPTTGLHMSDVQRLVRVINELVDAGHSVLVIEHNMEVIASADHVIDIGPDGGDSGGRIIACGHPREIVESEVSKTGKYLREYLKKYGQEG